VSVNTLLRKAVLHIIAEAPSHSQHLSAAQWEEEFEDGSTVSEYADMSDAAVSRESVYTREDEWR